MTRVSAKAERWILLGALTGSCLAPHAAGAQEPDPPDGAGESHWGVIPPEGDSVKAVFTTPGRAGWEYPLLIPYWIGGLPLRLLGAGIEAGTQAATRSPTVIRLIGWLTRDQARFTLAPGLEAGGLPGFGLGATFRADPFLWTESQLVADGRVTVKGDKRAHLGIRGPFADRGEVQFGAGLRIRPNARYFGIGRDTRKADESFFKSEEAWAGAGVGWGLGHGFHVETDAYWSRIGGFPTDEDTPALESRFEELPAGFGRFSDGVHLGVALIHDDAPGAGRPSRGGSRRLKASYLLSLDDEFTDLWTYRAEVQQFFPLLRKRQVLALRGLASWVDPTGAGTVPFQRLMANDDPDLIRGFEDFRFRDQGLLVLSAEYRWPLWVFTQADGVGIDVYLLADFGQVFQEPEDIQVHRFEASYGFGFRLLGYQGFLGRLELAHSDEQWVVRLRGDQVFQFAKAGLFHGRSRVPNR